jgi:DNA-binding MarR family transcriptional regulator
LSLGTLYSITEKGIDIFEKSENISESFSGSRWISSSLGLNTSEYCVLASLSFSLISSDFDIMEALRPRTPTEALDVLEAFNSLERKGLVERLT